MNTWLTLLEQQTKNNGTRVFDLWFCLPPISNEQLKRMWGLRLRLIPYWLAEPAYLWFKALRLKTFLLEPAQEDRDVHDFTSFEDPPLTFTHEEEKLGAALKQKIFGSDPDASWVCLHHRDGRYLNEQLATRDWTYHSYRDTPIGDYSDAAEALANAGYWVIRMGKVTQEPLESSNPRIIDYANSDLRSDFADVYLAANCTFFLSSSSGVDSLATLFKRPQVWVNLPNPFHPLVYKEDFLFIYKHFFDLDTGQALSLQELERRGAANFFETSAFKAARIGMRNNSPEEIATVAIQMHREITDPQLRDQLDSAPDQRAFWDAFPRLPNVHGIAPFRARIGHEFLAANRHLLA